MRGCREGVHGRPAHFSQGRRRRLPDPFGMPLSGAYASERCYKGSVRILVTGATGFIGRALVAEARRRGHGIVAVSRDAARARPTLGDVPVLPWNPGLEPLPGAALEAADAIIHLAGENVAGGRWTARRMAAIRDSRVHGTRNLVASFGGRKPGAFVCASAVGVYGDRGDEILTEASSPGDDFLARTCQRWEAEAARARDHGVRWVSIRTGVVLGRGGGALAKMLPAFRMNLGGPIAGGAQWMSWIHLDDIVGMFLHAAEQTTVQGPVNGTAPNPVTNAEFTRTLGRVLKKWTPLPMPRLVLRIVVGAFAEPLTASQRCAPARTEYAFAHPVLEGALRQICA